MGTLPNAYDFWPHYQDNKKFVVFYDAHIIKENKNDIKPKGSIDAISRFNKMIRKLDPDDNPVMVIVNLK